jgi:CRP/FNR family cyclic AMP-dependent transcriptional regulator
VSVVERALSQAALFYGMDPEEVSSLTGELNTVERGAGQIFFREGDTGSCFYIILSGKVKLGSRASDGRENLYSVLGPSDMFGEMCAIDPGPRGCTATAVTRARVVLVPREVLVSWMAQRPALSQRLLQMLARRLRRTEHDCSDLVFTDVPGRVAKQLLRLGCQFGVEERNGTRVTHDLTQQEFARLVGAARETVNKVLGEFSARGWLNLEGRSVLIADSGSLLARSRAVAPYSIPGNVEAITRAKRFMMNRFGIDDSQASNLLIKLSRDFNTAVSDVATDVVRGGLTARVVNQPLKDLS